MHTFKRVVFLSTLFFNALLHASEAEKNSVTAAVNAVALCEHWHGEVGDQSPARNAEIEAGANRDCPRAVQLLMDAYKKYPNNNLLYIPLLTMADYQHINLSDAEHKKMCVASPDFYSCKN